MSNMIYPTPTYELAHAYDGHKYRNMRLLSKNYLQEVYIDLGLTRKQLFEDCEINSYLFWCSYNHWFTKEERKIIGGKKIRESQRINNSNKQNSGVPRVILDSTTLQEYLDKKFALEKMSKLFNVAPQTVKANLKYHKLLGQLVKNGVPYERVVAANSLDAFLGTSILKGLETINVDLFSEDVKVTLRDLIHAEQALTSMRHTVKHLRNGIMARFTSRGIKLKGYKLPGSTLNSTVKLLLSELGYDTTVEFEVAGRFYDFKFRGYKLLLEIDNPHYHSTEDQIANDVLKNRLAEDNGYMLLRVYTDKSDKKVTLKKKLDACLAPLQLKRLPH